MIGFGQNWIKEYYFAGAPDGDWDDTPISVQHTSDNGFMIFSAYLIKTNIYGDTIWTKDIGHPEDGGDMVSVIMEVLLGKTIECLAHSISYARIGIMLLVHAALLLTVNQAFESLGGLSSPMAMVLIIGDR